MGIQDLQAFIEGLEGGAVSVDLLKIARNVTQRQQPQHQTRKIRGQNNKLHLIVDAECCLDRFYGGYFSDWACGGQWNRMVQFLSLLIQAIDRANIELAVVFNGTLENSRMTEWIQEQATVRQKVGMVLKHINTKATPPPKVWWTPPTCLRTALRMAFRHLNTTLLCTMDDHHQEVIAFCREYSFHGLLADDAEYAAFDPPRYFSSENIKLTYKGSLETKEYMLSELHKTLNLTQEQICVLAALLGNFILPESELQDFYRRAAIPIAKIGKESSGETIVKALAEYIRTLPAPANIDALIAEVLGSLEDKRANKLRQSVQYYLNGTANGFLKYCALPANKREMKKKNLQNNNNVKVVKNEDHELDTSGFASETTEQEQESLQNYKLATANVILPSDMVYGVHDSDGSLKSSPHEDVSPLSSDNSRFNSQANGSCSTINSTSISNGATASGSSTARGNAVASSSSSNSDSGPTSPKHAVVADTITANVVTPNVSADVLRTASLRHQKGLMAPWLLHVLTNREVRLACLMEDEGNREFPPIHEIYQSLRQRVYAVLFNLHHLRYMHTKKKESGEIPENSPLPDVLVKEWVYSRHNPYQYPELVKAEPLPWAVPTLQRLWFGPAVDDKRRRIRALLSCLDSDTPLILNTSYVPQHMLVMACVLRYVMSLEKPILRRQELDAFICQAFNPDLMNSQYLQELTLNVVSSRGVQLAALFMQGIEVALLANDACGAPLPWLLCCPWLYFDGKLFHHTLARSAHSKNLLELCENHIDRVVKVERMRKAILEGLEFKFAKIPLPPFQEECWIKVPPPHCLPAMPLRSARGGGNGGLRQRPLPARGGQLQVGGVVVGSWGANYGYMRQPQQQQHQHQQQQQQQQQQMMGGGFRGRGRGNMGNYPMQFGGRGQQQQLQGQQRKPGPPTFNVNRKNNVNKKKNAANKTKTSASRGRGMTMKTDVGDLPVSDILEENLLFAQDVAAAFEDCRSEHKGQGDGPPPPSDQQEVETPSN